MLNTPPPRQAQALASSQEGLLGTLRQILPHCPQPPLTVQTNLSLHRLLQTDLLYKTTDLPHKMTDLLHKLRLLQLLRMPFL